MKIAGKKIQGLNIEVVVIPRPSTVEVDGEGNKVETNNDIVFKARAVVDYSNFDLICPVPQMPTSQRPGSEPFKNPENKDYKKKVIAYNNHRILWTILESLKETPELEWETVKPELPDTWVNYQKELQDAGFVWREIELIVDAVWRANALDDKKIEEAKQRFLAGQGKGQ